MHCLPVRIALLTRTRCLVILALAALVLTGNGAVLYGTGFESTETPPFTAGVSTAAAPKLVGTGNWAMVVNPITVGTSLCYPFAAIDSDLVTGMGQTAALGYLGSSPPPSTTQFIRVGRKVDSEPVVAGNQPIIDFYCQIGLNQSTNSRNDDFELLVYNWEDKVLGGLTFDLTKNELFRYDANEFNTASTVSPYTDTGLSLSSLYGTVVEVTMHINYKTNTWTVTVGGVQVITGAPFTQRPVSGSNWATRTFGSLSARWYITTVGYPGNNWMLFDDWTISASAEQATIPATASAGYAANSTATIAITDAGSVGWTISSDQSWALVSPATGTGSRSVTATCAANPSATTRSASLTLGTQTCTLTQAAAPAVTTIPATASAAYAANSAGSIAVTSNTTWTASSNQTWAVVSPTSGSSNGTVTVTCAANPNAATRSAAVTVGTQTCILTQAASPYALWAAGLPTNSQGFTQDADHDGVSNGIEYALGRDATNATGSNGVSQLPVLTVTGSGTLRYLTITLSLPQPAPEDIICDIQACNNPSGPWTIIMEKSGNAPWNAVGNSGATVLSSPNGSGRTSYAISDTHGYRFLRLAVTAPSLAPAITTIPATIAASYAANSTATLAVTSNTDWQVSINQAWALISPASGSGNGTVTITCSANATASPRSAVIRIGGQTCLLTQAASPYAVWATGLAAGAQGFSQDADHDGVSNGVEYALGRDGASATGANGISQLPLITPMAGHLSMVLNLPDPAPMDIVYDVQVADDLSGSWTTIIEKSGTGPWNAPGNSGATVASSPSGSGRTTYTIADVQGHPFMRLTVKSF